MIEQSFGMNSGMTRHGCPTVKLVTLGKSGTKAYPVCFESMIFPSDS
jgi:hypothetical protein